MVNIRRSTWADLIPPKAAAPSVSRSAADAGQGDRWAWGTVSEVLEGGLVSVTLDGAEDDTPPVVAPSVAGVTSEGARARVLRDSTGRVVQVEAPLDLPEGAAPVYVGKAAQMLSEHRSRLEGIRGEWQSDVDAAKAALTGETTQAIDAARQELSAATSALESDLRNAQSQVQAAQSAAQGARDTAEQAASAAQRANSAASSASSAAASAQGKAEQAKTQAASAASSAQAASNAASQAQSQAQDAKTAASGAQTTAQSALSEARTGPVPTNRLTPGTTLIGGNLVASNTITGPHLVASESLSAKVASHLKVTTSHLIAGNAKITETLLANEINLKTRIVAGNKNGTHTVLDSQGLHVYRKTRTGQTVEAVRLGVNGSDDYLGISGPNGETMASIDAAGGGSFRQITVSGAASLEGLVLAGEDVGALIADRARLVSYIETDLSAPAINGTYHAPDATLMIDEHRVDNPGDTPLFALYTASSLNTRVETNAAGRETWGAIEVSLRHLDKPFGTYVQASIEGALLSRQIITNQGIGYSSPSMVCPFIVPPRTTRSLVVTVRAWNTKFKINRDEYKSSVVVFGACQPADSYPGRVIGWATDTGYKGYSPEATKQRYVKVYSPTWGATYQVWSGARYTGYDSDGVVVHGQVPGLSYYAKGAVGFPNLMGDLAGSTIEKIEVYVYMSHWYNHAGGTVGIGYHNALSLPSSMTGGVRQTEVHTSKPGGAWVTLPAHTHAAFISGAARGVLLMPRNQNLSEYGYADWRQTRLRITYTK